MIELPQCAKRYPGKLRVRRTRRWGANQTTARPERPRYSRPPTRLSASPVRETGLAVLDQLAPGHLAQADIEHRRQE